ncbi:hypothetical protein PIB30_054692 [Stylosanthes scabra]|uniref:Uncharacterized protein n=1 Tax=Stylosanthes scabra TaxID=79078 RepID=A0ABU6VJW0_9FABA|nr:hypothetical protein [Stylosanthes scabra]
MIFESAPISTRILCTKPGPSLAVITIGESESARPYTKSSFPKVIIRNCGGGVRTVAKIFKSFFRVDLDFYMALEPVMTTISMIGSSSSLRLLGFRDSDLGNLSLSEVVGSRMIWMNSFSLPSLMACSMASFRPLVVHSDQTFVWAAPGCLWIQFPMVVPGVVCLPVIPGSRVGFRIFRGCHYPIHLFPMNELFGYDLNVLPSPDRLSRQLLSEFIISKAVCEAQAGHPVDQTVNCLALSVKALNVFSNSSVWFLDHGQEVNGVFGVVNACGELVQEQLPDLGAGKSGGEGPTFDLIHRVVANHPMLEVVEVDVWVGGSVIFHIGWLDEVFGGLDLEGPTRERRMAVNGWGCIPASGPFVPPIGLSASVTITFRGKTRCHPSCCDDAFSSKGYEVVEFSWGSETEIGIGVWEESVHVIVNFALWSEVRRFPSSVPELPAPSIAYDVSVLG